MKDKLKKVSVRDIYGLIPFIILIIPAFIYKISLKIRKKELWLMGETEKTARDNGYVFFKYMREEHPEVDCYYAIGFNYKDYEKVKDLGHIIKWASLKHYFYYMSATKNISSHKEANPNQTIFTIMHLYLHLYNNRVFLQHGVLYQNFNMFHQPNTKFKIFITGAKPEYDFVKEKYEYKNNEVRYTGLARFDNLYNTTPDSKVILYMPTWRRWIENEEFLKNSDYYKKINSFINSPELEKVLEKNNVYLYFCPHNGLRDSKDVFESINKRVRIIDITEADIQQLLITGSLLITDFSSVHTDFAYMNKPILYYQYDTKDYLEKHIGKDCYDTYYDFKRDGFGKVVDDEKELIKNIDMKIKSKFKQNKIYQDRIAKFFVLHDNNNCKRIFEEIKKEIK